MTFWVGFSQKAHSEAVKRGYDESAFPIPCTKKTGDIDNRAKFVMDAMNGLVYCDDSQIYKLEATQYLSLDPRTEIEIFW